MSGWTRVSSLTNTPDAASGRLPPGGAPAADGLSPIRAGTGVKVGEAVPEHAASASPGARAWRRFRRNRLGFGSLLLFSALVLVSLLAEVVSNDRPLVVRYESTYYFPILKDYPEKTFGGDFDTATDYLDPFIRGKLSAGSNWAVYAPNPYGPKTLNYFASRPNPATPSSENFLGTDDRGRDLLAQFGINTQFQGDILQHTLATVLIAPDGRIAHRTDGSQWDPEEFVRRLSR